MRIMTLLWLLLVAATGTGLFMLKYEVQDQEAQLEALNRQIRDDREAVHVLRAEWAYLNDPARLAALAEKVLGMKAPRADQVVPLKDLPMPGDPMPAAPGVSAPAANASLRMFPVPPVRPSVRLATNREVRR